jgi:hypothetical protein
VINAFLAKLIELLGTYDLPNLMELGVASRHVDQVVSGLFLDLFLLYIRRRGSLVMQRYMQIAVIWARNMVFVVSSICRQQRGSNPKDLTVLGLRIDIRVLNDSHILQRKICWTQCCIGQKSSSQGDTECAGRVGNR